MKILPPNVEYVVDNHDDIFKRNRFRDGLCDLFVNSKQSLVVCLDESWGTGKTVFARDLVTEAREKGLHPIYFDAFKNDFEDDVFVAFAAKFYAESGATTAQKKTLTQKTKGVAKVLGSLALKGSVRAATLGAISASDIEDSSQEIAKSIAKTTHSTIDNMIDERLKSVEESESAFENFRNIASKIGEEQGNVVFVIDELDRCKPSFALDLMETIKHLFSVPNVHFLIVCDRKILNAAVKSRYGTAVDGYEYLEKFFNLVVTFPCLEKRGETTQMEQFIQQLFKAADFGYRDDDTEKSFVKGFAEISIQRGYSLRRVERIFTNFCLCMHFSSERTIKINPILFLLCDMKTNQTTLFGKAKSGTLTYDEVANIYGFPSDFEERAGSLGWYARWWNYALAENQEVAKVNFGEYGRNLFEYGIARTEIVEIFANQIVDNLDAR